MLNRVIVIGRVAAEPDARTTSRGIRLTRLRVATNTYAGRQADGARREHTEFHRLVLFGGQAEAAGAYARKGRLVYASGRLQTSTWQATDGQKRYATEIVVDTFRLLGHRADDPAPP
jgi:single-strand DNA-binding protein